MQKTRLANIVFYSIAIQIPSLILLIMLIIYGIKVKHLEDDITFAINLCYRQELKIKKWVKYNQVEIEDMKFEIMDISTMMDATWDFNDTIRPPSISEEWVDLTTDEIDSIWCLTNNCSLNDLDDYRTNRLMQ